MKESWQKQVKNIGVGIMATAGSLTMHGGAKAQTETLPQIDEKPIIEFVDYLMSNKILIELEGMDHLYDANIGKYNVEFYDANNNKKLDGQYERLSIGFKNKDGVWFSVQRNVVGLSAFALSFDELPGFTKTTIGASGNIIDGHDDSETIYAKNLSNDEVKNIIDDIKTLQFRTRFK